MNFFAKKRTTWVSTVYGHGVAARLREFSDANDLLQKGCEFKP